MKSNMEEKLKNDDPLPSESRWNIQSREVIHKNPWYEYRRDTGLTAAGKPFQYFYVHKGPSCIVLALTGEQKLLLVRQYRYLANADLLQLPGGSVPGVTSVEDVAKQELLEETGYAASSFELLGELHYAIGYAIDRVSVVLASGCSKKQAQQLDDSEAGMEVVVMPLQEVYAAMDDGKVTDTLTLAALSLARKRLLG